MDRTDGTARALDGLHCLGVGVTLEDVTRRVRPVLEALRAAGTWARHPRTTQTRATPTPAPTARVVGATSQAAAGDALAVIGALAVLNVIRHLVPAASTWVGATASLVLVACARRRGLSWAQLGMSRHQLRSGGLWGLGTIAAVSAVYLVGVLLPKTRPAFLDERHDVELPEALVSAFVGIPLGTVLLEEVAFRSVLPGVLARHTDIAKAHALSSALFGLWHVLPSLDFASARGLNSSHTHTHGQRSGTDGSGTAGAIGGATARPAALSTVQAVLGTVAFTAVGGAVAAHLRRRSDSVLASAGMHWATNGLGVLFGVAARRIAS